MGRCRRPQAEPPRASWVLPHTAGRRPLAGESAAYTRRHRNPLTHLYAKRSRQFGSWAGGPVGTRSGLVTPPSVTSPRRSGRAGAPCSGRPASGSAEPRPGPARTGPTREEERRRGRPGACSGKETTWRERMAGSRRRQTEGGSGG